MHQTNEARLRLIDDILSKKSLNSRLFVQYLTKERTYSQDDMLYMREAHFVVAVGPGDGKTMSELAQALEVTHGAVSQTALRLEKKGYITRRRDPQDHRQIIAALTEKGRRLYQDHVAYDREKFTGMDREYLYQFSDEELALIARYEAAMCAIFTKQDTED